MWLLLSIILNAGGVQHVEILAITHSEEECVKQQSHAIAQNPPENVRLGCLKLQGVKQVKWLKHVTTVESMIPTKANLPRLNADHHVILLEEKF